MTIFNSGGSGSSLESNGGGFAIDLSTIALPFVGKYRFSSSGGSSYEEQSASCSSSGYPRQGVYFYQYSIGSSTSYSITGCGTLYIFKNMYTPSSSASASNRYSIMYNVMIDGSYICEPVSISPSGSDYTPDSTWVKEAYDAFPSMKTYFKSNSSYNASFLYSGLKSAGTLKVIPCLNFLGNRDIGTDGKNYGAFIFDNYQYIIPVCIKFQFKQSISFDVTAYSAYNNAFLGYYVPE